MEKMFIIYASILWASTAGTSADLDTWWNVVSTSYPKYAETKTLLEDIQRDYPNLVRVYSIGASVQGRDLLGVNIRPNVTLQRKLLQPEMKLVGNMHGDETVGRAIMLMLIVDLVKNYENKSTRAVKLLENTDIHIIPTINPDGFESAKEGVCEPDPSKIGRLNANNVDLNRDFPQGRESKDDAQPETNHVTRFIKSKNFVLSANFHGGAVVACYPYDFSPGAPSGKENLTPDNDIFVYLAKLYAANHKTMQQVFHCVEKFSEGISNGAEWYSIYGTMQDFNYLQSNTFEITVELSCCKYPPGSALLAEWGNNKDALYKFMEATHLGVRGFVKDASGNVVSNAKVKVKGRKHGIYTTAHGEYWRLLLPGMYEVAAKSAKYKSTNWKSVKIPNTVGLDNIIVENFTLTEPGSEPPDEEDDGRGEESKSPKVAPSTWSMLLLFSRLLFTFAFTSITNECST